MTCPTGKIEMTRRESLAASGALRRRLHRVNRYRCKKCGAWHIGKNRYKPKQRGRPR